MCDRQHLYLAEVPRSGRALFSRSEDARDWCDRQFSYHFPRVAVSWISGGDHGWQAQRWSGAEPEREEGGTVYELKLDGTLPDYGEGD